MTATKHSSTASAIPALDVPAGSGSGFMTVCGARWNLELAVESMSEGNCYAALEQAETAVVILKNLLRPNNPVCHGEKQSHE